MRVREILAITFSILVTLTCVAEAQNKIVIDRSPFFAAEFSIRNSTPDEIKKNITHTSSPNQLRVEFYDIAKDRGSSGFRHNLMFLWKGVSIVVDPRITGMVISYERDQDFRSNKLTLFVPSKHDKQVWEKSATARIQTYEKDFFEAQQERERLHRQWLADQKAKEDLLTKGPILVYPK